MERRARNLRNPPPDGCRGRHGGTLVQTLVVLAIIAVLFAFLLPVLTRARGAAKAANCLSNLRGVSAALITYAADNDRQFPYPAFSQIPWERSLAKYAEIESFTCPGDEELAPATGSSYDWRDTGIPETTLAGQNPLTARADAVLAFDALPGWHAKGQMNVVRADGSALPMDAAECILDLHRPARSP